MSPQLDPIRVPGGKVTVGTDRPVYPQDGEGPARLVKLRPFRIDATPVTVARFAAFVAATGHVTEAERLGWSPVFRIFLPDGERARAEGAPWWERVEGAHWRRPHGPTSAEAPPDHPVVQVSWNDAREFAAWAGGRLPSEAEWEAAAAGGLDRPRFPWGEREPDDTEFLPANIWQGRFPDQNSAADGHVGTSPVGAYPPNGLGLFDMAGNVWEWCHEAFRVRGLGREAREADARAVAEQKKVAKGGSHLCHRSYCYRYRIAARLGLPPDSASGNLGFRLVYDA